MERWVFQFSTDFVPNHQLLLQTAELDSDSENKPLSVNIDKTFGDKLLIYTDNSALSAGFVLVKVDENLHFHPIMAESRLFVKSEKRTSIVFKEALSLLLALQKCEKYVKSNQNTVMLFSDAISLSQIQKLKNSNSKLYELSLLMTSFPNLQVNFIKGRWNIFADIMSRRIFSAVLNDETLDSDILSISHDVRQLLDDEMISLSHQSLNEYLLNHNNGDMIDLLKKKRIFNVKKEHLKVNSPYDMPNERQLSFLLIQSSKFDLRHLNLSILRDYLLSLNKAKIGKNVLEEFVKFSMTKISKECLNQLYPMNKQQIDGFLDECKNKNCPDFLRSDCKNIKHPLEDKIKNIYLSESHEWKYKNKKDLNIGNSIDLDLNCEANLAVFGNPAYNKAEIDSFLYQEKCENCQYEGKNANCQFKSENTLNLLETLKVLYLTLDNTIDKKFDFSRATTN